MGAPSLERLVVLNPLGAAVGERIAAVDPRLVVINDREAPGWARAHEVDVLLTAPGHGWRQAPAQAPAGWPGTLRWVHTASVGVDFFPPWLLQVPQVSCARGVAAAPIADYVLSAMLAHNQPWADRRVQSPEAWRREFERAEAQPLRLLAGQHLGLLGFGAIGQAVARRALAFGMQVTALRRSAAPLGEPGVAQARSLPELLAQVDHLVLALPITAESRHVINAEALAHARPGLHLVNIARGALVDQQALLQALDSGRLGAATLDVTDPEPLPVGHPLYTHPGVRLTPHISWAAGEVQTATADKFIDQLQRYFKGEPLADLVDAQRGY